LIPSNIASSKRDRIRHIRMMLPEISKLKLTNAEDPDLVTDLLNFEKQNIITKYKFGVLFAKDNQIEEDDILSNDTHSAEFEEFLNVLGKRIELKGWPNFSGGLDVQSNATGTHSDYTKFNDYEIMFHVSTLLPLQPDDKQRVERKRHIGNDVVVVLFKEGNLPFDPRRITSHFNHNFIVVQVNEKAKDGTTASYRIGVANKPNVAPYSPYIPFPPVLTKREFREFLLTKLINAERSSMNGGEFKANILRTRKFVLAELIKRSQSRLKRPIRSKSQEDWTKKKDENRQTSEESNTEKPQTLSKVKSVDNHDSNSSNDKADVKKTPLSQSSSSESETPEQSSSKILKVDSNEVIIEKLDLDKVYSKLDDFSTWLTNACQIDAQSFNPVEFRDKLYWVVTTSISDYIISGRSQLLMESKSIAAHGISVVKFQEKRKLMASAASLDKRFEKIQLEFRERLAKYLKSFKASTSSNKQTIVDVNTTPDEQS